MFFASEIHVWHLADVLSISPSLEQTPTKG